MSLVQIHDYFIFLQQSIYLSIDIFLSFPTMASLIFNIILKTCCNFFMKTMKLWQDTLNNLETSRNLNLQDNLLILYCCSVSYRNQTKLSLSIFVKLR